MKKMETADNLLNDQISNYFSGKRKTRRDSPVTVSVQVLKPKAMKLLETLADLKLIAIKEDQNSSLMTVIKKLRSGRVKISEKEIQEEVELVRQARYDKKA